MSKDVFEDYKEAVIHAKELAANKNECTVIKKQVFWKVEVYQKKTNRIDSNHDNQGYPFHKEDKLKNNNTEDLIDEFDDDYSIDSDIYDDHDYLETQREIQEEALEYSDSMARSEEDGWFYPDVDDGMENNIIDPNS